MPTVVPCSARIASAAWRPSSVWVGGIRMSTIATSGACSRTAASRAPASPAWATTSKPASIEQPRDPLAEEERVVGQDEAERHAPSTSARMAAPDSSSFGMNPRASAAARRGP